MDPLSDSDSPKAGDRAPILGRPVESASVVKSTHTAADSRTLPESNGHMDGEHASSSSRTMAAPVHYQIPINNGGQSSPSRPTDDLSREFYRRATLRATTVMFLVAFVCLFTVPIVALMILPVGAMVIWWLRSPSRFANGGDLTKCMNRDSCLNFYIILLCATIVVNAIDIIFLLCEVFSASPVASTTTGYASNSIMEASSRQHQVGITAPPIMTLYASDAQYHAAHRSLMLFDLVVNSVSAVVASYSLFVAKKLQALLVD